MERRSDRFLNFMENDERLIRIEAKLDKVVDAVSDVKATQAAQHVTLEEHTKRSTMLEEIVVPMHEKYTTAVTLSKSAFFMATLGGAGAAIVESGIALLKYLHIKG